MTPTEFAVFKYQHADGAVRSKLRMGVTGACLVAAVLALGLLAFVVCAVLVVAALVVWFSAPRELLLGPRYLLCGNTIVYFGNVKRMTLSPSHGKLRLECNNGKAFVLERDKFPTGARKAEKITKSKARKFDKVSSNIMEKVRAASANVVLIGA
ncbi:MAG: hypothetical protein V4858_28745 [Pseudomonadota bacterium]